MPELQKDDPRSSRPYIYHDWHSELSDDHFHRLLKLKEEIFSLKNDILNSTTNEGDVGSKMALIQLSIAMESFDTAINVNKRNDDGAKNR